MDNEQCNDCIHREVCAYKNHYEDVVELYKKATVEAGKFPWFKLSIYCVKHEVGKLKRAREEISEMRKDQNVSVTDCLDILDKLIAESEGKK